LDFSRYKELNNQTIKTYENYSETQNIKTGFYQRVFGQVRVAAIILQRFEIGLEYRHGVGIPSHPIGSPQRNSIPVCSNQPWLDTPM